MPIYEYECRECGHRLEVLQRMSDDPLSDCPSCNASALKKLVSAVGFQLKGTGWYETDFKHKGKPEAKSSGEGESSSKSGSTDNNSKSKTTKSESSSAKTDSS